MYRITGADGREYGPVGEAQLRQWIMEGRANAGTRIKSEGSDEWVLPGALTEFANALAAPLPPLPPVVGPSPQRAQDIMPADYRIDIGDCIGRAWELVKRDFWLLVGGAVVAGLICTGGFIPIISVLIGPPGTRRPCSQF